MATAEKEQLLVGESRRPVAIVGKISPSSHTSTSEPTASKIAKALFYYFLSQIARIEQNVVIYI